jgi:hypothetical protein
VLALVVAALSAWLVATAVAQFWTLPWVARWKAYDLAEVVPGWSFFAPNPGSSDAELLYRDEQVDGALGPWTAIRFARSTLLRALWNPDKRRRKSLHDLSAALLGEAGTGLERNEVILGSAYLTLLYYVSMAPTGPMSAKRQFILARSFGDHGGSPQIVFISAWHRL